MSSGIGRAPAKPESASRRRPLFRLFRAPLGSMLMTAILMMTGTALPFGALAAEPLSADREMIGIDQRPGEYIPKDLVFRDESGAAFPLSKLSGKPVVLGLVYYTCPGICIPFLDGLGHTIELARSEPGRDYHLVTVSFDPNDGPEAAARKKREILGSFKKRVLPSESWTFLTGDTDAIKRLTSAVGFRYKSGEVGYLHSSAAIVLSPDGRITRYMLGVDFLPMDLELALAEAREGKVAPAVAKLLKFCFSYDPKGRKYVFDVTKVGGAVITLGGVLLFGGLVLLKRRDAENESKAEPVNEEPKRS